MGERAALEVLFADGVWYRGSLVERVAGSRPPRWTVQFDDGEVRDDIRLGPRDREASVRFDASAYGSTVEVRFDGQWHRGRLVELVRGSEQWGVAFENGDWAEEVRLGGPDVRYVFAGRAGAGRAGKRGRAEDVVEGKATESRMRVRTATGGRDRSGGSANSASSARQRMPAQVSSSAGDLNRPARGSAPSQAHKMPVHKEEEDASEEEEQSPKKRRVGNAGGEVRGGRQARREDEGGGESGDEEVVCAEESPKKEKQGRGSKAGGAKGERPHVHVCETCGRTCSRLSLLAAHMRTHSGERPHVCETCGKAFSESRDLAAHTRTHSGERPYVCATCGKKFSQSANLAKHMLTHSGEMPHVCETCGKAFSQSANLAKHMLTHSGERPYVCNVCGKAFSQAGSLAGHMRTHSGERPHVCETCGKVFSQSSHLARHIRTHTSVQP